ncbi:MAG: hypothetical protein HQK77_10030 [Desulfobacterales bacterium]|nr:hypothetical protein [Desulfobacterales bacterium]
MKLLDKEISDDLYDMVVSWMDEPSYELEQISDNPVEKVSLKKFQEYCDHIGGIDAVYFINHLFYLENRIKKLEGKR